MGDMDKIKCKQTSGKYGHDVTSHISELYYPPRVTYMARRMGMIPGIAFDLTMNDPDDWMPWDFNNAEKANTTWDMIKHQRPLLLIGSPMCSAFSQSRIWFLEE